MRRKFVLILVIVIHLMPLGAVQFRFKYTEGEQYRIVSQVFEDVKYNDEYLFSSQILNRIAVTVESVEDGVGNLRALYQISERRGDEDAYGWSFEDSVRFSRTPFGVYGAISKDRALPSVRNIPTFPQRDLNPGDSWNEPGLEIHDLLPFFSIDYRLPIPFRVFYQYEGEVNVEGQILDLITIEYNIVHREEVLDLSIRHPDWGNLFPEKILGSFKQKYYWSRDKGRPEKVDEEFFFSYKLSDGNTYSFSGYSKGRVVSAQTMDREEMVQSIDNIIKNEGIDDVSVHIDENGVSITLEDILFLPESALLREGEKLKLRGIAKILDKYRDRDIQISGHTARFGTEESSQVLSEERARSVATFLVESGIRSEDEIISRGYGSTKPTGDNSTLEGQKQNRRVEILILEN